MISTFYISEFPIAAISKEVLVALEVGKVQYRDDSRKWGRAISLLSAFLDIVDRRLEPKDLTSERTTERAIRGFEGFLIEHTKYSKRVISSIYSEILRTLSKCLKFPLTASRTRQNESSNRVNDSVAFYESQTKSLEKIKFYQGWFITSRNNTKTFINLAEFQSLYGTKTTEYLIARMNEKLRKYAHHSVSGYTALIRFIIKMMCLIYKNRDSLNALLNPNKVNAFAEYCFTYGLLHTITSKNDIQNYYATWSRTVKVFKNVFCESEFIAKPAHPILTPTYTTAIHSKDMEYNKTFTKIPLTLNTDEALDELKFLLQKNRKSIIAACRQTCAQELVRLRRFNNLRRQGKVITSFDGLTHNLDYSNKDIAATWHRSPYCSNDLIAETKLGSEKLQENLYMLRSTTLLPFIYLIILYNPNITPSWFTNLELYNLKGRMTGFTQANNGYVARSRKERAKKIQAIYLDNQSAKLFKAIIKLTSHARLHLQKINDPDWRMLLISCRKGFSSPQKMTNIPNLKNLPQKTSFIKNLAQHFGEIQPSYRSAQLSRLTPRSIRADQLVIRFLETLSETEVSVAAGHSKRSKRLVEEYIPPEVRYFVMERWIRQFQNAIIYEVMKTSRHLLDCIDFSTENELDWFLRNTRSDFELDFSKKIPSHSTKDSKPQQSDRIYISLNKEKILILLSIYDLVIEGLQKKRVITKTALVWFRVASLVKTASSLASEGQIGTYCSQAAAYLLKNSRSDLSITKKLIGSVYEES
ncbi:hypothetical protein ACQ4OD_13145 [Pseudomonas sp. WC1]|uniref:hypothetical protein n=1 Tax=Pseudomonas sp. WC1 TaxID=3424772 RepID=UPI003D32D194